MYQLNELLSAAGLDEKEIPIFSYLIVCGPQTAGTIAKKLDLQRSSAYILLGKMVQHEFLETFTRNGLSFFATIHPRLLVNQSRRRCGQDLVKLSLLEKAITSQFECFRGTSTPKSSYHTGTQGLLKIMDAIIAEKPQLVKAFIPRAFQDFIFNNISGYYRERVKYQIPAQVIYAVQQLESSSNSSWREMRESKIISADLDFGTGFILFGQKVAIMSPADQLGVVIDSASVSDCHNKLFDFAWAQASKV